MIPITDIHCHLLPGLDDGPKSMNETIETLKTAYSQGISAIIVTPHFHPEHCPVTRKEIIKTLMEVEEQRRKEKIPITLYPGQECFYYTGLVKRIRKGEVLTLCNSSYVLVGFSPDVPFSMLRRGLDDLRNGGYTPVLAHFERYQCLLKDENLTEIKDSGVLLQMNFSTLKKKNLFLPEGHFRPLARKGVVDFFASDCHGTEYRPMNIMEEVKWMEKRMNPQLMKKCLVENVNMILSEGGEDWGKALNE